MARIKLFKPLDQPRNTDRLMRELQSCFASPDFNHFRCAVAFVKSGPLLRLSGALTAWRKKGNISEAIFGIDHQVTSKQGLELSLQLLDATYIAHAGAYCTFHPKYYLFTGKKRAVYFVGSNNLTVGGTETNFEAGVRVDMDIPGDAVSLTQAIAAYEELLPTNFPITQKLTPTLLAAFVTQGKVCDETKPSIPSIIPRSASGTTTPTPSATSTTPRFRPVPPTPLPPKAPGTAKSKSPKPSIAGSTPAAALIIQIVPHANGEVFLSKLAINQHPSFFGWPFSGRTTPKKTGNPAYPQRDPDPIVDIAIYDSKGRLVFAKKGYRLNTVFYDTKAEMRVTFSPDILAHMPKLSIMVMRRTGLVSPEYSIEVFHPGSRDFASYLASCNQTLPSGGAAQSRRMGWI